MSQLTIIVAFDARHGIGINNTLPWHLPEDLQRFKRITSGHAIIMGRKTYQSIGRPLPNRRNIVLTRQATSDWQVPGLETAHSLPAALQLLNQQDAFIIGGADIYTQALPLCSTLLVTEVDHDAHCDAFFPVIDDTDWQETAREAHFSEKNGFAFSFVTYQKISTL